MITRDELIAIGHFNKPHGVTGEISATLDVDFEVMKQLSCLVCDMEGIFVPFFIESSRPKSHETALLTIDGIDNEQEAAQLVNHDIFALKREYQHESEDMEADGYPLDFFIGYDLQDVDGTSIGEIADVDLSTENAIFVVNGENDRQLMIPANDELIVEFDLEEKVMVMDLPQGLLDLND